MVDSNTYQDPITGAGGYDNPHADQLTWIAANKDAGKNSIVFQHIPMPEIYNLVTEDAGGTTTSGGVPYAKSLNSNATGSLGEFPCPPAAENNTGEFTALQNMGGVLGVFTGHDHLNDFTGTYDGMTMTAVPGMTYFNYGDEAVRGYGVIELDESDLSSYDYHTVKFSQMDTITSPYAFNVDFSAGNAIETSGNATAITGNGSTVTYSFDSTLNKTVANFDGTTGYGYTLSETAKNKMRDGYTYEILYKLPSAPSAETDLASGMYGNAGFGVEFKSGTEFRYWQGVNESQQYRKLYYSADSYATGSWLHIVAVWDPTLRSGSGQLRGFLNGVYKDYSNPASNEITFDANGEFYIGGNSNSSGAFRDGTASSIAFVRIHDKAYSDSEIADLYTEAITPGAGAVDGLYHPYDEIEYEDLLKNNLALDDEFTFGGGNILTYKATSPTYSAKLKFRWTVGTDLGIQFSFDKSGTNLMSYPFGVWVKKPNNNSAGENGAWHLKPTSGSMLVNMDSLPAEGDTFDIELGRLKIMENAASHAGQYYVYLKVNGTLIRDTYISDVDAYGNYTSSSNPCHLSNEIVFDDWGSYGNKISATPTGETYAPYDEIGYEDLLDTGNNHLTAGGRTLTSQNNLFHYTATSETHSAIYKFRWVAGNDIKFQVHPGGYGGSNNFAYRIYDTNFVQRNPSLNSAIGYTINEGNELDLEVARLMVTSGENAGKYYTYFKVNDTLIFEKYVTAAESNTASYLGDTIQMNLNDSSHYCYIKPYGAPTETSAYDALYYDYDEIEYGDLNYNGAPLASETTLGNRLLSYNRTSPTYSAILRYRWKAVAGSKFQLSFDRKGTESAINYMFGVQLYAPESEGRDNNSIRLRPGMDDANAWVELSENIETDVYYNVEFARLKVKTGPNAGKYHVYFKLDDVLIAESYVAANIVDVSGNYTSSPSASSCYLSNLIYITFWGGGGADAISAIPAPPEPETYEDYDEVYYSNLLYNGEPVAAERSGSGKMYTYNKTSSSGSAILKLRWKNANPETQFQMSFDKKGSSNAINYMFGVQLYKPDNDHPNGRVWLRPGYGPSVDFDSALVAGQNYDIEFARIKVVLGPNKGKYYMYFKLNDTLIAEDYVAADVVDGSGNYSSKPNTDDALTPCQISNEIYITFWGGSGATITYPENYAEYDEIGYGDLLYGGDPIPGRTFAINNNKVVFTYNRTSDTYSSVLKYRWVAGDPAKFSLSFDTNGSGDVSYPFCAVAKYPNQSGYGATAGANGAWQIDPTQDSLLVNMSSPIVAGNPYDIEFGRLKVISGPYTGKYYVYFKVDGTLIQSRYYQVNNDGTYNSTSLSNNIVLSIYSSSGNQILTYGAPLSVSHVGRVGDFNNDGSIGTFDFQKFSKLLLGTEDLGEMPETILDYNNDSKVDICDYVSMKKQFLLANSYSKSGSLKLGMQEHLLEDSTKTAAYIADASATLGSSAYRLSMPIHNLYYVTAVNGVGVRSDNMEKFKAQIAALKAQGINEILYVTDSFILPYGYANSSVNHNKTVPNPSNDMANYTAWLNVNALAFKELAEECPEIKFFEPFNEINLSDTHLEKPGCAWDASSSVHANYSYTTAERAGIMADLCWYVTRAVKSVDILNQVTTPSIAVGSASIIESGFLNTFYNEIESGNYPRGNALSDKRKDNFFTIINIHTYPEYSTSSSTRTTNVNNAANRIGNNIYNVMQNHMDGGSRVWLTETGISIDPARNESYGADIITKFLNKINSNLTYIDTVFFYKVADISSSAGAGDSETYYGLFYSGDNATASKRYGAKQTAKAVYSFFHNGSTNYTALDSLKSRYAS